MNELQISYLCSIGVAPNNAGTITVECRKMGRTDFYTYVTPDEARELITMLTAAIAEAEKQKEK